MKQALYCAALCALSSLSTAQETLGAYFDSAGTLTSTSVEPLVPFTVYIIADNIPAGISGYEFYVSTPAEVLVLSGTALGNGNVLDIDSSPQGFITGMAGCMLGSGPHVLAELLCMATLEVSAGPIAILPSTPSSFGGTATGYAECGTLALYPFVEAYPGPALITAEFPNSYCHCDGSGTSSPCANPGSPGHGCANGTTAAGARLQSSGAASVAASSLVLEASGIPSGQPGLYFQGDNQVNGGAGVMFGDGLRCAGGGVLRLQVTTAGAPTTADLASQGALSAGDTRYYQLWYRDANGSPCGSQFNLTNGLKITWTN